MSGSARLFLAAVALVAGSGWLAVLAHGLAQRAALVRADPDALHGDSALARYGVAKGRAVFIARCATCHRPDGSGSQRDGVPDLHDGDWLYGEGRVSEIEAVVRYGIRAGDPRGWNLASMPAFASTRPYAAEPLPPLDPRETDDIVQLLLRYEGRPHDPGTASRGVAVFQKAGCWDCHGADGSGDSAVGAPNLRDSITLYDGSRAGLTRTVERGRAGTSPAFARTLSPVETRAVALYVAALSHGAKSP